MSHSVLTEEDFSKWDAIFSDPNTLENLISDRTEAYLIILEQLVNAGEVGQKLAVKGMTSRMSPIQGETGPALEHFLDTGHEHWQRSFTGRTLSLIKKLPNELQAEALAADGVFWCFNFLDSFNEAFNISKNLSVGQQAHILTGDHALRTIADEDVEWVWNIVKNQSHEQQAAILKGYNAAGGLADNGYGEEVWSLITQDCFTDDDRAAFLDGSIRELADDGFAAEIVDCLKKFRPEQTAHMLCDMDDLRSFIDNGYTDEIFLVIGSLPPEQRREIWATYNRQNDKKVQTLAAMKTALIKDSLRDDPPTRASKLSLDRS